MMTEYDEQQQDEIEALESIYPDSFTITSTNPHCFSITVVTEEADAYDEYNESLSTSLQFTYTPKYPDEVPLFEILETNGLPDDNSEDKLNNVISEQMEENLGMAMIFTIVSAIQEFLNETRDEIIKRIKDEAERKEREEKEAEERKCQGTPVNVATFLAWKTKFDQEMAEIEKIKLLNEKKTKKLSGKEIFLQMNISENDSELLDGEVEAVEVDESLFEDLDDLELEDDEDFDAS